MSDHAKLEKRERTPVLGPMSERLKTDLRLPYALVKRVEDLADRLGVPKNAIFAFAAMDLVIRFSSLEQPKNREALLDELEKMFQTSLTEARKQP